MSLRERLHEGEVLVGTFCAIPSHVAIEITAMTGFDFVLIDGEHSLIDRGMLEHFVRAAEITRTPILFRVPGSEGDWIASVLDAGANGLVVPRVETAAEARAIVAATRYPPQGKRGVGPGRAAGYGARMPAYLASANNELLLVLQVETAEGLTNIDEIAAVEGVDAIYIGPGDLAASLGAFGPQGKSKLDAAIESIIAACHRHNRIPGLFNIGPKDLVEMIGRGVRFHTVGSDTLFLMEGAAASLKALRSAQVEAAQS